LTSGYGLVYAPSDSGTSIYVQTSPDGSRWTDPVSTQQNALNFWDSGVTSNGDDLVFNSETFSQQPAIYFNRCTYPCSTIAVQALVVGPAVVPVGLRTGDAASTITASEGGVLVLSYCRDNADFGSNVAALVSTDGGINWTNLQIANLNYTCGGHTFGGSPAKLTTNGMGAFVWVGPSHQLHLAQVNLFEWTLSGTFLGISGSSLCRLVGESTAASQCWSDFGHDATLVPPSNPHAFVTQWYSLIRAMLITSVMTAGNDYGFLYAREY